MVTCIGSAMGKVAMNRESCITNQQINSIIVSDQYSSAYIYYLLLNNHKKLRNAATGSTAVPLLNKTDFDNLAFQVHANKCEQQKISTVLSCIDEKIECNNRINEKLESLAELLYDYWFIQFDFPDKNGKPYKSSGGAMSYSEIFKREIPVGWCNAAIDDILDKTPFSVKVPNQDILVTGNIPVLDQGQNYIAGFTNEISALIEPKQPHVVFGDHTRVVKLVNFNYARGADGTQILVSKDSRLPGYVMYQAVKRIDLSNYGYARHFKFLKEVMIILPEESISSKYQAIVSPMYEKIKELIFENLELAKLRDWLLPMLMNGQVTVS
jgi:type I restriction enzyme S subunit